jgi:hypothetical protein
MTDEPARDDAGHNEGSTLDAERGDSAERTLAEWRVHLFPQHPAKSAAVLVVLAVALVLIQLLLESPWLTILGGLILAGSLSDWLFPITYRLTTQSASYKNAVFRKRIAWDDVRRVSVADFGVKLSPFASRSRLEPFRALILRFGGGSDGAGDRGSVMRIVKTYARCKRNVENQ